MFYTGAWVTWTTPVAFSIQTGVPYLYHPSSTALVTAFNIYNTKVPTLCRQFGFLIILSLSDPMDEEHWPYPGWCKKYIVDRGYKFSFGISRWPDLDRRLYRFFLFLFRPDIDKPTQFLWLAWKRNFGWKLFLLFLNGEKVYLDIDSLFGLLSSKRSIFCIWCISKVLWGSHEKG